MKNLATALIALVVLASCANCAIMDCAIFNDIEVGERIDTVVACAGSPACIRECEDGLLEYVYITCNKFGHNYHRQRTYILTVDSDTIIATECEEEEYYHHRFRMDPYTTY